MPIASSMAETEDKTGAPIAKDAIDPELVKLRRKRPNVGIVTAAGLVFLCVFFVVRLSGDRKFAGAGTPTPVAVADVLSGKVPLESNVTVEAEPIVSHALRAGVSKGVLGLRVAPARGTGDRLWLVVSGDGWDAPNVAGYSGRLRRLSDLPFATAVRVYTAEHPRPLFATAAAVRAGFATNKVAMVSSETVALDAKDRVAFDVVDPNAAVVVASLNERIPDAAAWRAAMTAAGIAVGAETAIPEMHEVRFEIAQPDAVATVTTKLEGAKLFAARVDPVTRHFDTTWGVLRASPPEGFKVDTLVPEAQLDLVGLYVGRDVPADAYAVVSGEHPADYWYIMPITIGLAVIGLVFAWALVRAVRRDLLSPKAA
jgi:hypothetical protein